MRKLVVIMMILSCEFQLNAQLKFAERIDTTVEHLNPYLSDGVNTISDLDGVDDSIDPYHFDSCLLSAAVFCLLNENRKRKNRDQLSYNPELENIGWNYANVRSKYNFRTPDKARYRFNRDVRRMRPLFDANQDLWHAMFCRMHALDYKTPKSFFRDKDETTSHQLVYGSFKDKLDSNYVPNPISSITYKSLALKIVCNLTRRHNRKEALSKHQSSMAVHAFVDERTLNRQKIPMINVIVVMGANRFS